MSFHFISLASIGLLLAVSPVASPNEQGPAPILRVHFVDPQSRNSASNLQAFSRLFESGRECAGVKFTRTLVGLENEAEWTRAIKEVADDRQTLLLASSGGITTRAHALLKQAVIVFQTHGNPVSAGYVQSLNHPGGRATGVTYYFNLRAKQIELLLDLNPRIRRIGVIADKGFLETTFTPAQRNDLSRRFEVELVPIAVATVAELESRLAGDRIDAAVVPYSLPSYREAERMARLLEAHRIAAIYDRMHFLLHGGAMVMEPQGLNGREELVKTVGLICRGVDPGSIPVARYRNVKTVASVDAIQRLGIAATADFWRLVDQTSP